MLVSEILSMNPSNSSMTLVSISQNKEVDKITNMAKKNAISIVTIVHNAVHNIEKELISSDLIQNLQLI